MRARIRTGLVAAIGVTALLAGSASAAPARPASPQAIAAALSDSGRPEADTKQDASRKPAELIAFMKIRPGDTVADLVPGGGYWTRIFSTLAGPKGQVIAYVPEEMAGFKSDPMGKMKALAAEPGRGNVMPYSDPLAAAPPESAKNSIDVVWTFENYHDFHDSFMKGASVADFNKAMFTVIKPGGYYIVGDHAAVAGTGLAHTEDLHRIDPATVKAEIEAAGFLFDGELKVLANPADPRTAKVFDPSIRGSTDRFIYRFRKPK